MTVSGDPGTLALIGLEPSQFDFADPRRGEGMWLGPSDAGQLGVLRAAPAPWALRVEVAVLQLGAAAGPACRLDLCGSVRGPVRFVVTAPGVLSADLELNGGASWLRIRTDDTPTRDRYYMDPRPLMIYVRSITITAIPKPALDQR